jgi:DNA-binding NtrC family response regulator
MLAASMSPSSAAAHSTPVDVPRTSTLLIICNQPAMAVAYREAAEAQEFRVRVLTDPEESLRAVTADRFDAVLIDMAIPEAAVLGLAREVKVRRAQTSVVLASAQASVGGAVEAMRAGCFDYLAKPFDLDDLNGVLGNVAIHLRSRVESRGAAERLRTPQGFANMVGATPEMQKLYRIITKAAHSRHPVLILGESGTGKEMVARAIHYSGAQRDKPFLPVDCGSLVPTLIEAELFGYTKGAFTGATRNKEGLLAIANGGTVFLDEIGELPLDLQSKLLRALQEQEIRPVGATHTQRIDVRVLAATNRNLEFAVDQGMFRKDLFYRLNVLTLRIPPLRQRKDDIPLLAHSFLSRVSRSAGRQYSISEEAMRLLTSYDWPGNVRELENCLDRASAMSSGPALHVGDLPSTLQNARAAAHQASSASATQGARHIVPIAELEKQAIYSALEQLKGDKLMAARMLGIGKTTLYRKLKEYGL